MTSNEIIITSVVLYVIILVLAYFYYLNRDYNGGEIAGNAMAKGLTFFYGLGVLFLIAIVFTVVNAFFSKTLPRLGSNFFFSSPYYYHYSSLPLPFLKTNFPALG